MLVFKICALHSTVSDWNKKTAKERNKKDTKKKDTKRKKQKKKS
jgi:hypothetical protein